MRGEREKNGRTVVFAHSFRFPIPVSFIPCCLIDLKLCDEAEVGNGLRLEVLIYGPCYPLSMV